jgi:uroporphyrinogen III methyltransferase/synthase
MAVKNIAALTKKLIENGRSPETPVAVVRWGTRADQVTITSTLGEIANVVRERDIKPPAVMVVGEVVKLREQLNWCEIKPLFGVRVLVTRENSRGFEPLEDLGAEVIELPAIKIIPPESWEGLDSAMDKAVRARNRKGMWLIFTSANGVRHFFARFFEKGHDIRDLKGIKICAIGSKTASEVRQYGINVDMIPEEFRAEGLVESFLKLSGKGDLRGMKFLLPRAERARETFPEAVKRLGGRIDVPVAYRAVIPERRPKRIKSFLREGRITVATFTSGATFNNFMTIMGDDADKLLEGVAIAVIGPVTKKAVEKYGHKVDIMPRESTIEAMVQEIINWAQKRPEKSS